MIEGLKEPWTRTDTVFPIVTHRDISSITHRLYARRMLNQSEPMAVTFMDAMGDVRSVSPAPKHLHEAVMAGARYRRIRAETRLAEVRTGDQACTCSFFARCTSSLVEQDTRRALTEVRYSWRSSDTIN
jgi:hypothetical protein